MNLTVNIQDQTDDTDNWRTVAKKHIKANSLRIHFARLFLILIIVMLHFRMEPVDTSNAISSVHEFIRETFLRLPVPLLSIMSGYIFFASGAYETVGKTLSAKMRSLIIPFLIFNTPLVLAVYVAQFNGMALDNRIVLVGAGLRQWLEALFAITEQPVNYPLYFLRDLFVVAMLGLLIGRLHVRFALPTLLTIAIVAYGNLDGFLIIRDDVLLCFFLGGYLAISQVNISVLDKYGWAISIIILPAICFAFHFLFPEQRLLFRVAGGLAFWPVIGFMLESNVLRRASAYAKYAFPIYLMHAPIIFALLIANLGAQASKLGAMWWIIAPLVIASLIIGFTKLAGQLVPRLAGIALGGRIIGRT
ncbi:MAG: acyltransferase [Hyphomicrobiales bacterium]